MYGGGCAQDQYQRIGGDKLCAKYPYQSGFSGEADNCQNEHRRNAGHLNHAAEQVAGIFGVDGVRNAGIFGEYRHRYGVTDAGKDLTQLIAKAEKSSRRCTDGKADHNRDHLLAGQLKT